MNFIPVDTDLDNLIDQLIQNQNPTHLADMERQRKERLDLIRQEEQDTEAMIFTDENRQNMEEMKQLNQINLIEILAEKEESSAKVQAADEETKDQDTTVQISTSGDNVLSSPTKQMKQQQQTKIDYLD